MYTFEVTLTEEQYLACQSCMLSCEDWTINAIHERARRATDDIVQKYVREAMENNWQIPTNKLDLIKDAYARGVIKTAAQQNADAEASRLGS